MDGEVKEESDSPSPRLTYGEYFKEWFPFYLNCGMTRAEYWDEDSSLVGYYLRAYMMRRDEQNYMNWLQGAYNFTALSAALANFGMGLAGKHGRPEEYPSEPRRIRGMTEEEREAEDERKRREIVAKLNRFHAIMEAKQNAEQHN